MISLEKWKNLTPLQKLPKNVDNLANVWTAMTLPWPTKTWHFFNSIYASEMIFLTKKLMHLLL